MFPWLQLSVCSRHHSTTRGFTLQEVNYFNSLITPILFVLNSCFLSSNSQSASRNGNNSGRRRNPVVSCVTVDSDEEHRSPQKSTQVISQSMGIPVISGMNRQKQNNINLQMNNNMNSKTQSNSNQNMKDVKPEINTTSYATQKKRLLAKAQSESLIGNNGNNTMKQEPGVNEQTGSNGDMDKPNHPNGNKG